MKQLLAFAAVGAAVLVPVTASGPAHADVYSHNKHISAHKAVTRCHPTTHTARGRVRLVNMTSQVQFYVVRGTVYDGKKVVRRVRQNASVDPIATQIYPFHSDVNGRYHEGFKLEKGQRVVMRVSFNGEQLVDRVASYSECWSA